MFRFIPAAAALIMVGLALTVPALAQFTPASAPPQIGGTNIDLAPIANAVIQLAAAVITVVVIPVLWKVFRKYSADTLLADLKIEEQYRTNIDQGAVAAIGAATAKLQVQPGTMTVDVKNQIVAEAGQRLAENFADSIKALSGDKSVLSKATEIVESRVGLTEANAAGAPVIGVTTPAAAVQAAASDNKPRA